VHWYALPRSSFQLGIDCLLYGYSYRFCLTLVSSSCRPIPVLWYMRLNCYSSFVVWSPHKILKCLFFVTFDVYCIRGVLASCHVQLYPILWMHNEYNRALTRLGAGVVICLERGTDLSMAELMPLSLASVKSRLVFPFWYRLTWVVPEKGPLNGCVCVLHIKCKKSQQLRVLTVCHSDVLRD